MSTCNTYTGDLELSINSEGDWDVDYFNGQPCMTDSFSTMVTLAVFGEPDTWQNELTNNPEEKYISEFPEVIRKGTINNDTLNDGRSAIKKSLQFMIDSNMAQSINVSGSVISVFGLSWSIVIPKPNGDDFKYNINWEKGIINAVTNNTNSQRN